MKVLLPNQVLKIWLSTSGTVCCVMDEIVGAGSYMPVSVTATASGDTTLMTANGTSIRRIPTMSVINCGAGSISVYLKVDTNRITHTFVLGVGEGAYYDGVRWQTSAGSGPQGPAGPEGPAGPQGLQGDTGPAGTDGSAGSTGPAGADGADGNDGAQGSQGQQGIQGIQGIQGPQGNTGSQGPAGPSAFAINVQALTSSPTDAQTIYFGMLPKAPVTAAATSKIYVRTTSTIKRAEIYCYSGTAGTAENWSLYIRKNNTTDTLIATVGAATSERVFSNTGLSIAMASGDYFEIKAVNPTWGTNPLTTIFGGIVYIEG